MTDVAFCNLKGMLIPYSVLGYFLKIFKIQRTTDDALMTTQVKHAMTHTTVESI